MTTEVIAKFNDLVIDHARPMTGGHTWQWRKIATMWDEHMNDIEGGDLLEAVNRIRHESGFSPLDCD